MTKPNLLLPDSTATVFRFGKSWTKDYIFHSTFIKDKNKIFFESLTFLKKRTKVERSVAESHFIGAIYLGSLMYQY